MRARYPCLVIYAIRLFQEYYRLLMDLCGRLMACDDDGDGNDNNSECRYNY